MTSTDLFVYRRLLPVLRPYRARLLLVVATSIGGPLVVAARIWLLKVLIDDVLRGHRTGLVSVVAAGFVVLALARAALSAIGDRASGGVGAQVVRDLRVRVYESLQAQSLRYFHRQRLGDLLTRVSGDSAAIEDLLVGGLSDFLTYAVTIVLFLSLLVVLDPGLVGVALLVVPALAIVAVVGARRSRQAQAEIRDRSSQLVSAAEEGLSAVALVKAFARGSHELQRFAGAADAGVAARLRAVRIRVTFPLLADVLAAAGTAAVVWIGAGKVMANQLSVGTLVVFVSYLASLYTPIHGLSRLTSTVQRAMVGAGRVLEVLETPPELRERSGQRAMPPVRGKVRFDRVTFGYAADRPVLCDVTFGIRPGEIVALTGASGAGKTTVVSLLLSYYDPDRGDVFLDGHPLRRYDPTSCREQVAAVLQEPMLLDTTVRENIRYGRLDASDADIVAAARVAQATEFINGLPDGFDTLVGPRGARLSGGQRQRLAIARAVLKQAPVLVLDEATSALDPATEADVLTALRDTCSDSAVLLVAHRSSTISHADRVIVLDSGRVVGERLNAGYA